MIPPSEPAAAGDDPMAGTTAMTDDRTADPAIPEDDAGPVDTAAEGALDEAGSGETSTEAEATGPAEPEDVPLPPLRAGIEDAADLFSEASQALLAALDAAERTREIARAVAVSVTPDNIDLSRHVEASLSATRDRLDSVIAGVTDEQWLLASTTRSLDAIAGRRVRDPQQDLAIARARTAPYRRLSADATAPDLPLLALPVPGSPRVGRGVVTGAAGSPAPVAGGTLPAVSPAPVEEERPAGASRGFSRILGLLRSSKATADASDPEDHGTVSGPGPAAGPATSTDVPAGHAPGSDREAPEAELDHADATETEEAAGGAPADPSEAPDDDEAGPTAGPRRPPGPVSGIRKGKRPRRAAAALVIGLTALAASPFTSGFKAVGRTELAGGIVRAVVGGHVIVPAQHVTLGILVPVLGASADNVTPAGVDSGASAQDTAAILESGASPDPQTSTPAVQPAVQPSVVRHVPTKGRLVALTFDDGYSGARLREIMAILVDKNVPATFFVNGIYLHRDPEAWEDLAAAGFTVGNHTWGHTDVTTMSSAQIARSLQRTAEEYERITGMPMAPIFRPPYGRHDAASDAAVAAAGYPTIVLWDTTSAESARSITVAGSVDRATRGSSGSIVLMHVGPDLTPRVLREVIQSYAARGFTFVTVPELIAAGQGD